MRATTSTTILLLGGLVLFVDMFLRWGRYAGAFTNSFTGWDAALTEWGGLLLLALVLVEFVRTRGIWWTPASSLLGFFLGASGGILVIAGLIHLHWGSSVVSLRFSEFAYGAWIALAFAVVVLIGAWIRLEEHRAGTST
ncbi:MAG TPA: hypothetical protein VEH52_14225 [Gaiellaceae bacterium]|nr:hypothetical protein [Gaiellaceae bacterium]